jgi:hypothetical protein
MAATLTLVVAKPSSIVLRFSGAAGDDITIQKSGAVAPNVDLSIFAPGPLKAYLERLENWGPAIFGTAGDRTRFRWVGQGNYDQLPLFGAPTVIQAMLPQITQSAATALQIRAFTGAAGTIFTFEWGFIHSLVR